MAMPLPSTNVQNQIIKHTKYREIYTHNRWVQRKIQKAKQKHTKEHITNWKVQQALSFNVVMKFKWL